MCCNIYAVFCKSSAHGFLKSTYMPGVEIYAFNVNLVLMVCCNLQMPGVEINTCHGYFDEFQVNLHRKGGMSLYNCN